MWEGCAGENNGLLLSCGVSLGGRIDPENNQFPFSRASLDEV